MGRALPHYNVLIDPVGLSDADGSNYADVVEGIINQIARQATGRAILAKIKAHGWVRVYPYGPDQQKIHGTCNAITNSADSLLEWDNTEIDGQIFVSGASAKIGFSPKTWSASNRCSKGPGNHPDEVLHHELLHAGRKMGRDFGNVHLHGALAGYDTNEEFYAITITNIYMSEAGRTGDGLFTNLVANHGSVQMLKLMAISEVFLSISGVYDLIDTYCQQHSKIAPMIASVAAEFNPLRTYYEWQSRGYKPPDATA